MGSVTNRVCAGCLGHVHPEPNFRHNKPVLAYDGPPTTTHTARGWNDPTSSDQSAGNYSAIVDVERCFFTTSSQYLFSARDVARQRYIIRAGLYTDVLALGRQWPQPRSAVRGCIILLV